MVRKASGGWCPVIDLKQLNRHIDAPHFHMHTISSVLSTVEKRRLHVQNRSAGYVFSCTNTSTQQEVPSFCLPKSVYQFRVLSFSLNTAPQVLTCLSHRVAAYLHHQAQLLNILNMVGLRLNEAKSELEAV